MNNWQNPESGKCENNPSYMLISCATSCLHSFYNLSTPDIDGNAIPFSAFQGKVVILTNVASYCGYTQSHYTQLVELWGHFRDAGDVEILVSPCKHFGKQDPGTKDEIKTFVQGKGVSFRMMQKIDVN